LTIEANVPLFICKNDIWVFSEGMKIESRLATFYGTAGGVRL